VARVKIATSTKTQEIDLWGSIYTLKSTTRSVKQELKQLMDRYRSEDSALGEDDELDDDVQIERIGEQWDVLFTPKDDEAPASEVLAAKWENDEVSMTEIQEFDAKLAQQMLPPSLARSQPR
jgi:hypothetical protein